MKFRYFLECLHCATEGIDGRRYRNRSTFYYKEKIYFQNVHFYFSENISLSSEPFQGATLKTTIFLETT